MSGVLKEPGAERLAARQTAPTVTGAVPGRAPGALSASAIAIFRVYLLVYLAVLALAGVLGWAGWTVLT